jgi:hypothetical protein
MVEETEVDVTVEAVVVVASRVAVDDPDKVGSEFKLWCVDDDSEGRTWTA